MHNPSQPLPDATAHAYTNPAYYAFVRASHAVGPSSRSSSRAKSVRSVRSETGRSRRTLKGGGGEVDDDALSVFKKQFSEFHAQNGVRTVFGTIGPVSNGESWVFMQRERSKSATSRRASFAELSKSPHMHAACLMCTAPLSLNSVRMLLKTGYRHVYMSRTFAAANRFSASSSALMPVRGGPPRRSWIHVTSLTRPRLLCDAACSPSRRCTRALRLWRWVCFCSLRALPRVAYRRLVP